MSSNKVACVHITRNDIRLAEGRVSDGVMLVTKTAAVPKASRFFHGDRLAFMADMVGAIIDAMKVNSFAAKTLHIVYDNGVDVQFFVDEKLTSQKKEKKGLNFSFGKKDEDGQKKETGTIVHKKSWGKYITESEQGELYTTVTMERDLVNFLVSEFQERGYKVASLEPPETALLYMRKFVPFSYDALNKLVIYANDQNEGTTYLFTKDVPAGTTPLHFEDVPADNFVDKLIGVVKEEIRKKVLVNPHILLVGDAFADPDEYIECCKALKEEGLYCIDTYSLWRDRSAPITAMKVITPSAGAEVDLNGRYGICVALLARTLEQKPENMVEGIHPMYVGRGTKRTVIEILSIVSALVLIYGAIGAGISCFEVYTAKQEYERASTATEATLALVQQQRDAVKAQVDNLSTIDSRYNEIFKFVYAQVNENLNIASVDTEDLIPTDESPSSVYSSQTTTDQASGSMSEGQDAQSGDQSTGGTVDVTGASSTSSYKMKTIVIRGYSRTTSGPVELYNSLVAAGMGEVKVVGVEQVPLPSDETLFAFELTVGTNDGEGGA